MGLVTVNLIRLCQILQSRGIDGKSLCMLGKQSLLIELSEVIYIFNKMNIKYDVNLLEKIKEKECVDTYEFFECLGFKEVHALDFTSDDGADIIFNLNDKNLPEELVEKFDYVLDGGTLEHVFDIAQALENMSRIVKTGGYVIHLSPAGGYIDHGFYSFSPTFFNDFYTKNGYLIEVLDIGFYYDKKGYKEWAVAYSMDCRLFDNFVEIDKYMKHIFNIYEVGRKMVWCVARKKEVKGTIYPIKSVYDKNKLTSYKNNAETPSITIDFEKIILHIKKAVGKKIILFASGQICNLVINELYKNNLQDAVVYILDNDVNKAGTNFRGYQVLYPNSKTLVADEIIVCSIKYCDEIYMDLINKHGQIANIHKITEFLK